MSKEEKPEKIDPELLHSAEGGTVMRFEPNLEFQVLFDLCNSPAMNKQWFLLLFLKRSEKKIKEIVSFQIFKYP